MSLNVGGISVRAKLGVTPAKVAASIETFWKARGAERNDAGAEKIEPLAITHKNSGRLGYAIAKKQKGWITVLESERYHASVGLAQALATALKTQVVYYEINGASDSGCMRCFTKAGEVEQSLGFPDDDEEAEALEDVALSTVVEEWVIETGLPFAFEYYDQLGASTGFVRLGFEGVAAETYEATRSDTREDGAGPYEARDDASEETADGCAPAAIEAIVAWLRGPASEQDLGLDVEARFAAARQAGRLPNDSLKLTEVGDQLRQDQRWAELAAVSEAVLAHDRVYYRRRWREDAARALIETGELARAELLIRAGMIDLDMTTSRIFTIAADYHAARGETADAELLRQAAPALFWIERQNNARQKGDRVSDPDAVVALYLRWLGTWDLPALPGEALATMAGNFFSKLAPAPLAAARAAEARAEATRQYDWCQTLETTAQTGTPAEIDGMLASIPRARSAKLAAHLYNAGCYAGQRELWEQAARLAAASVACPEFPVQAGNMYLIALQHVGRIAEAQAYVPTALKYGPQNPYNYHSAGCVLLKAGERAAALATLALARTHRYECLYQMRDDPDLAPLLGDPDFEAIFSPLVGAIRERAADGRWLVRDGLTVAFFVRAPFAQAAPGLLAFFNAYLEAIPEGALKYASVGASSSEFKPVTKTTFGRCRSQLDPDKAKRDLVAFHVMDEEELPGYSFDFVGHVGARGECSDVMEAAFPSEFIGQFGVERFVDWLVACATAIPFVSGYADLALRSTSPAAYDADRDERLTALARLYPGMDISANASTAYGIGTRTRGARWLTFLGAELLRDHGGEAALAADLPPGIEQRAVGPGRLWRLGVEPNAGGDSRWDAATYRAAARALAPATIFDDKLHSLLDRYPGGATAWARRFLAST